jgi:hypothetical protein
MLVVNELKNWNAIVDLEAEGVQKVVDDHHVFGLTVLDDPEVFDKEAVLGLHAVLSGQDI